MGCGFPRAVCAALVAVVTAVGPAAGQVPGFDTSRVYSESAFEQAIRPYTEALARNASDARAHYWLGVAYLHAFRLYRWGLAPYAAGYGVRAVQSLERAAELDPQPVVLLALLEAYAAVGDRARYHALIGRLGQLATPLPVR
ncbi:MAG: tetratricopeptide repeat protein [Armatimonadota bacterium]|nr:tetratricopeptide repeat protein [Armatimonadota bacterium]MDR7400624.1 tetratricopeptide repeat protein [Armatimonadota bacterium]MDR7403152.1 tetratricopeptide repeat protein [Armatimonadota bacterium]MDR7438021.1 tetratricopeptide repeat protein [Armatimonadota bacterium]MDR7472073.1 tetratricopeptide repeat protein [Armatimonadota bacterium]